MPKPCILITSVGSHAAEETLACLEPLRSQIRLVATNSIAEAPGLFDVDVAYIVPATADASAFESRMKEIIARELPDLVINGRDQEVEMLPGILRSGAHKPDFLGPPASISNIFNDKYNSAQFAKEHGLPFAPTAITAEETRSLVEQHGFPLIAKPRKGGFASHDVFVLSCPEHVQAVLARGGLVIQAYLRRDDQADPVSAWQNVVGIPWVWKPLNTYHSFSLVIGRDGSVISSCVMQAQRAGSDVKTFEFIEDAAMDRIVEQHCAVFSAAGHRGPLNVQGVRLGETEFVAFEWNARFGGSTHGFALKGVNQVVTAVLDHFPELQAPPASETESCTVFRPQHYRAVRNSDIASLRKNGRWEA